AFGPELQPLGPGVELFRRIAGLEIIVALLQPRINEIGGNVRYRRIGAVLGEHDWRLDLAQQGDEGGRAKTVMPDFNDMAELAPVQLARQQFEELAEIGFVEFLGWRE